MKSVCDSVACVRVNFDPPEFVRVTDCTWLVPTGMLPKLIVEGFSASCPLAPNAFEVIERTARER